MSVVIGGPYGRLAIMLNTLSSLNIEIIIIIILSKNRILKSIKCSNSVENSQKTKVNNTNINLVNDNVYTKFGLNLFILSQDIEQKPNSDINQGP